MSKAPVCPIHRTRLICPACQGQRGGQQTSPRKIAAARENVRKARAALAAKKAAND